MVPSTEPEIIVAIASAPGPGARGIVRLSGPGLPGVLEPHLVLSPLPEDERWTGEKVPPRGIVRARLRGVPGVPPDLPCLALVLRGPASYTGEDGLELYPPASPVLLDAIVAGLITAGRARGRSIGPAGPGDFSLRAWRNGRLDLVEAEAVAAVIAAADEADLRAARALAGGRFRRRVESIAADLALTLARLEAGLDFADEEDVVILEAGALAGRIERHAADVAELAAAGGRQEAVAGLPRVVLTGAPNAGKSTLFNALLGREAAITSPEAGTTRDVLEATCDLPGDQTATDRAAAAAAAAAGGGGGGGDAAAGGCASGVSAVEFSAATVPDRGRRILLADAAGLDQADEASGGARGAAQGRAVRAVAEADVRLACVPVDRPVEELAAWTMAGSGGPAGRHGTDAGPAIILVRTMADLLGDPPDRGRAIDHAAGDAWISARTGDGISSLQGLLERVLDGRLAGRGAASGVLARHRAALGAARERLQEAAELVSADRRERPGAATASPELVAAVLREALDELGAIGGAQTADDVLGMVFGSFCIGK